MTTLSIARASTTSSGISNPPTSGNTTQRKQLRAAFQELAKNGSVGYTEAMALRYYGITLRASNKYGFSTYVGKSIYVHPNVLLRGRKYTARVVAHETGHAIFERSGLYASTYYRGLPRGVLGAVNEAFAGVMANRVQASQYSSTRKISLLGEFDRIVKDPFYARYYGINANDVRAARGPIKDALRATLPTLRAFGVRDSTVRAGL